MRYNYSCLVVRCWQETVYTPDQLREAVEHLRCAQQTPHTNLMAVTQIQIGDKTYMAMPTIRYSEIMGKKAREVWAVLDEKTAYSLDRRIHGSLADR